VIRTSLKKHRVRIVLTLTAAAAVATLVGVPTRLAAQAPLLVVATGLDNPRGLSFGPDGGLYVAEAGRGGSSTACAPAPDPPFANRCYGPSGAITRILAVGDQRRVVVGLPSIAPANGGNAQGPSDVEFGLGATFVTIGFAGNPANRAPLEAVGAQMGRLVRINSIGQPETLLDLSAYEVAANPDGGAIDSNPFGLEITSSGAFYADAGANAVMRIALTGAISTLAVFPNRQPFPGTPTVQAVPTSVAVAPNGDIYVGELTGAPFIVGAAQVYRIPAAGGTPQVVATGFTNIIDIAFGPDGRGYVLEHDIDGIIAPGVEGRLTRLNADGSRTVLASAGLTKPGGVAIGPDGAAYVTTFTNSAGIGQVVRIAQ
jgi:hypothetical protein